MRISRRWMIFTTAIITIVGIGVYWGFYHLEKVR